MALEVPEWLNEEFLTLCLQGENNCGEKIEVMKFTPLPVVSEGNNVASSIIRVSLEFKNGREEKIQVKSLILKYPLKGGLGEMFEAFKDIESKFYNQFLPLAKKLNCDSFAPKSYFSPEKTILIMEDLKETGFLMKDKSVHLDYDHCHLYITTAALFHAVSIAIHKFDAELVESLGDEKLFSEELKTTDCYKTLMKQGLECTSDFMEKTEFRKYANLVRGAESYLYDEVIEAHKLSEGLNCINQGDPWIPNMMFRYDDSGKVSEAKILDFQALRYGSPANDLVFFLWCSANHDVRENRLKDIFHLYCDTLNKKLKDLNCSESLMYDDLLKAVQVLRPLMLFVVVAFTPLQVTPGFIDVAEILSSEINENGKPVNKMAKYFSQYYCDNFLLRYLRQLECIGVFEYLEKHSPHTNR